MLTQELLKERLTYDPSTGIFRARVKRKQLNVGDVAGSWTSKGYWRIKIDDQEYSAHRLAWMYMYGEFPPKHLDHINQDRADNRIDNLREANYCENGQNRRLGRNSTSGYLGVTYSKQSDKWQASICIHKRHKYLGQFATPEQAAAAYAAAKQIYHPFEPTVKM